MRSALTLSGAALAALLSTFGATAWAEGEHKMTLAKDLTWADVPSAPPGLKIAIIEGPMDQPTPFTIRLKFPANYVLPPHTHPGVERVTVLSGAAHMGMEKKFDAAKATMVVGPGDVMIMQPNTPHFLMAKEETIVQVHSTGPWKIIYIDPADDPRKKPQ